MAQPSLSAHMYNVLYLELPPDYKVKGFTPSGFTYFPIATYYGKPQYIVLDSNLSDFSYYNSSNFSVSNYIVGNYSLYESLGPLKVYKEDNT
jgi:hypothetical protein